jgi:hypothetical protein
VLTYTFPLLTSAVGISGAFLVYSGVCFLGAALVFLTIPETKGRPLEEISATFADGSRPQAISDRTGD